ncbi:MAG: PBS lyase [Desulfobulbaceae bacterium]|uniref:PBS lyase n=1 Tax=Candidatus Desulfobia pelagia TaxID=2841692 RepID=A0A8J6TFB5_9BACT|nr:PBS lyase [Candidatus Desulfobia pelagia]
MKNPTIKVLPWCPFCGQDVDQPQEPVQRKMDEFKVGSCECGAVYTSDPTGFNVGSAMVECMVYACNDNSELAWDLTADEDYISGRVDNYDEQTHQVYETKNVDGRKVAGVLYFIRLTRDIADLSKSIEGHKKKQAEPKDKGKKFQPPPMEPARDPKRKKKNVTKKDIDQCVANNDIDTLVDFAFDNLKTFRFLQRLFYDPDENKRWHAAHITGQVCARLSTRKPGAVSDLLHRLFEACTDSAASHWGLLETIGSIIAARPDIFGSFSRHLLMYRGIPTSRVHVLWALGTIAATSPQTVRNMPIYSVFSFINNPDSFTRGHAVRLFGRIQATEMKGEIETLINDDAKLTVYEKGLPVETTVGALAKEALEKIAQHGEE